MSQDSAPSPARRAGRSFWALVIVSVLVAGSLSAALTAAPGPLTGIRVAGNGLLLIVTISLATRVYVAIFRAERRARSGAQNAPTDPPLDLQNRQRS